MPLPVHEEPSIVTEIIAKKNCISGTLHDGKVLLFIQILILDSSLDYLSLLHLQALSHDKWMALAVHLR